MTEYDLDRIRCFNVDGRPAIASGVVAAKLVNGFFVAVLPSAVRAEGVEISEAEFDAMCNAPAVVDAMERVLGVDSRRMYPLRVVTFSD